MTTTTRSADLTIKVGAAYPLLGLATARLFEAPDLAARYPYYLRAMHNIVCATVPLMEESMRLLAAADDDPLAAPLLEYYGGHVDEERGHDDLVLEDLAALDLPASFVTDRPPFLGATVLVGTQYYWIRHVHPVVLLGHVFVFEGFPMSEGRVDQLAATTGLPDAAFGSLHLHSALDAEHRQDLLALLDRLPIPPTLEAAIGLNALATIRHAAALMDELVALTV
jgi:hypothetical protein